MPSPLMNFEWRGRCGRIPLFLSEHTFAPSRVSILLAEALRVRKGATVIDMGCGSGILSVVAAKLGAGRVVAVDEAPDVVEVGKLNAESQGVSDVVTFYEGDLFEPLPEDLRADVIIGDVSGIPDALAARTGWFPNGKGGGPRGSELPIRMLEQAMRRLRPDGRLLLPTGTLQDEEAILDVAHRLFSSLRQVAERSFPFPSDLTETPDLDQLTSAGVVRLVPRGSRHLWSARIWECCRSTAQGLP